MIQVRSCNFYYTNNNLCDKNQYFKFNYHVIIKINNPIETNVSNNLMFKYMSLIWYIMNHETSYISYVIHQSLILGNVGLYVCWILVQCIDCMLDFG